MIHGRVAMTYQELYERVDKCAAMLEVHGVRPGQVTAVSMNRSIGMIVSLLAIMKERGVYLPLEPGLPEERKAAILQTCEARVLVVASRRPVAESRADDARGDSIETIRLAPKGRAKQSGDKAASDECCVMFTSGTTATSRGVVLTHASIMTRFYWMWSAHPFSDDDVGVIHRSFGVIGSLWDTFGPLLAGVRSVIVSVSPSTDIVALWRAMVDNGVSRMSATPSLWRALIECGAREQGAGARLRLGVSAGEKLGSELVGRWKRAFPNGRLLNVYGTTECNTPLAFDTSELSTNAQSVPIGKAIDGAEVHILDREQRPVEDGEIGELYVGGKCLACGYLADPALTRDRFVMWPASSGEERLFRTGDLVRLDKKKDIEIVGRRDRQVKIRGYRVDLDIVEDALCRCSGVTEAAVLLAENSSKLTGYVVAKVSCDQVRGEMAELLPDYMRPSEYCAVGGIPKTAGGKVDRLALCQSHALGERKRVGTPVDSEMCQAMRDVFGEKPIDWAVSFEAMGGDSLDAMRLVAWCRQVLNVEIGAKDVYGARTLRDLAKDVGRRMRTMQG